MTRFFPNGEARAMLRPTDNTEFYEDLQERIAETVAAQIHNGD